MSLHEFAAFLSYASEDEAWTRVLRENLERCLAHLGYEPAKVFDPAIDVGAGRSWVTRLNQGLGEAERVILVATPESFTAPGVAQEWETQIISRKGWQPEWVADRFLPHGVRKQPLAGPGMPSGVRSTAGGSEREGPFSG